MIQNFQILYSNLSVSVMGLFINSQSLITLNRTDVWEYAIETTNYIHNWIIGSPHSDIQNKIPYVILFKYISMIYD
jgi:hypothetical protein